MAVLNLRTPNGYDGSRATNKKQGITRFATAQEAAAGLADNVALTPAHVSSTFATPPVLGSGTPNEVHSTGLSVVEGANAKQGIATLVAGTVVVANTSVTANSRILLTAQNLGTVTAPSSLCVSARTAGTSFTILASQNTDTSTVAYEIFEQA